MFEESRQIQSSISPFFFFFGGGGVSKRIQGAVAISDIHLKSILTLWGRDRRAVIFQTTVSDAFSWMVTYEFRLRFHWILFLRVKLRVPALVQIMAWHQWWSVYWRIYASLELNSSLVCTQCAAQLSTRSELLHRALLCENFTTEMDVLDERDSIG